MSAHDYSAISRHQHERHREIRQAAADIGERIAHTVSHQASEIREQLGTAKLARIADYRAERWERLAATTGYPDNASYYRGRSAAWRQVLNNLDHGDGS